MDLNTIAVIFLLVVAPTLCAVSIPLLKWLEDRNAKKQREIDTEIDRLHQ